jgi:general secretion pathway protein L
MTKALYLHPHGIADGGHHWPAVLVVGELTERMSLAQAASRLGAEPVGVILPVELFSCWQTGPWPKRRRPSLQALGYAVEEQLAAPLESLYWAAGAYDAQLRCAVRACDAEAFAAILAILQEVGVRIASLQLDADLLPAQQPCALWLFERWLVGGAMDMRLALSAADLEALGEGLPAALVRLNGAGEPDAAAIRRLQPQMSCAPELLASPTRSWRWPVKALALTVVALWSIECALNWSSAWQYRRDAELIDVRTLEHLNSLLPEALHGQSILQQLKALQGQSPAHVQTLAQRLQALGEALLGASDLKVRRIEYRADDGWKIHVSAAAMGDIERLRERAVAQRLPLLLLSATQEAGRTLAVMQLEAHP